mgnify:FL=1
MLNPIEPGNPDLHGYPEERRKGMEWHLPKNRDNDLLICSSTKEGLAKQLKDMKAKITVYSPEYAQEVIVPFHNLKGEQIGEQKLTMYCVQAMQKENTQ